MRFDRNRPDLLTEVEWFFCPPGAELFPDWHRFASANWEGNFPAADTTLGELGVTQRWRDGKPPPTAKGKGYCGPLSAFTLGVDLTNGPIIPYDLFGLPIACNLPAGPPPGSLELADTLPAMGEIGLGVPDDQLFPTECCPDGFPEHLIFRIEGSPDIGLFGVDATGLIIDMVATPNPGGTHWIGDGSISGSAFFADFWCDGANWAVTFGNDVTILDAESFDPSTEECVMPKFGSAPAGCDYSVGLT